MLKWKILPLDCTAWIHIRVPDTGCQIRTDVDKKIIEAVCYYIRIGEKPLLPFHLHRILQTRRQYGEYHRLVQELWLDGERFQWYFRLDRAQFDELLARVGPRITWLDTNWRSPISAAERLAI
ncbi:hypothetical protein AAFF_G00050490 [Aldrovandia affinis]|uniref:Uncharacterized protein n=1 Tax=Aldrovandia affinis TaxID=143900 RepID=A0AAD7WZT1_9TELE|nr:hypothetical protein AAFF_G00050490 [Aldrovandia affinis]